MPFDYRSMLIRYIARVQYQEGISYFVRRDFTIEEAKEVALLIEEADSLYDYGEPSSPRSDSDMWVDDPIQPPLSIKSE